jgi:mono/diheme cytochrome c family protein
MSRRIVSVFAAIPLLGGAAALAVLSGAFERSVVSEAVTQPLRPERIAELVPKGRYLAAAADCVACHTAAGGAPWAGGVPFAMPIGTLYATNISPDPDTGIGNWTRADFHRALRDGVGKNGRRLYPAMPYVSYRDMSEEDVDAIYAFMTTREPVRLANKTDSFPFPYVRPAMAFWNLISLPGRAVPADVGKPEPWNRGRYLTDALGHCGECHTPRNVIMAMNGSRYLQGSLIEGVDAPDITPAGLAGLGFTRDSLADYFRTGLGPHGVMSFPMADVFAHSTRYLTKEDAAAMATYLTGSAVPAPPMTAPVRPSIATGEGRQLYVQLCSGCHGLEGEGIPHVAPAMTTNASLRFPDPLNVLFVVLDGLPGGEFPDLERMQPMPGFRYLLSDAEIAELMTYLRATWTDAAAPVTVSAVTAARERAAK